MKKVIFILLIVTLSLSKCRVSFGQDLIPHISSLSAYNSLSETISIPVGCDNQLNLIDGYFRDITYTELASSQSYEKANPKPLNVWDDLYQQNYIGLGAFGTLKHPGLEFNYSIADKTFIKYKKGKQKLKIRRWELYTRYYYHRNFHHNIMLSAGRSWQRILRKERFFISQADVGVARTFYDRPTFQVVNDEVQRMWLAGDFYFNFNYRFGFGKHFHVNEKIYRLYSYFGLMNFFPYNNLYYSRIYIGLNLNSFIK